MKIINRKCPLFTRGLDDKLKVELIDGPMSPQEILTLRGLYDSTHETPLVPDDKTTITEEDIAKYSKVLSDFKKEVSRNDMEAQKLHRIKMSTSGISTAFVTLNDTYRGATKIRRIALMATMVHQCLEDFRRDKGITEMSNSEVISTYFGTPEAFFRGDPKLGSDLKYTVVARFFDKMKSLEKLRGQYPASHFKYEELTKVIEEYRRIITDKNIFQALSILAAPQIKDNDGIKYSLDFSYSFDNTVDDEAYAELEYLMMEETKKDGWMEHTDEISSYKGMSRKVKAALKFLPLYAVDEEGNPKTDDSGRFVKIYDDMYVEKYEDPIVVHRGLLEICNVDSEQDFLKGIEELGLYNPVYISLYSKLKRDPSLLSAMRQEYYKTHLKYRFLDKKKGFGIAKALSGNILTKSNMITNYLINLKNKKNIFIGTSIFKLASKSTSEDYEERKQSKEEVYFDKDKVEEFKSFIKEWFVKDGDSAFATNKYSQQKFEKKKELIKRALEYLNIDSKDVISNLFTAKVVNKIVKQLVEIVEGNYFKEDGLYTLTAKGYLETTIGKDPTNLLLDTIGNIIYLVENQKPRKLERSVRWENKTLFNHILPSLLSDIIDTFKRGIGAHKMLRNYIDQTFLCSSQFKGNAHDPEAQPIIYNRILSDLYQEDSSLADVVDKILENLDISRSLGVRGKDFSEFDTAEHLELGLAEFFGRYNRNKIQYVTQEQYNKLKEEKKLYSSVDYYIEGTPYYYAGKGNKKLPRKTFANFSTFILGDANQFKTVSHPIYSYDECVEGLYHIALSEIAYHKQKVAANEILNSEGCDDLIRVDRIFGFLHFLNDVPEFKGKTVKEIEATVDLRSIIIDNIESFLAKEREDIEAKLKEFELTDSFLASIETKYPFKDKNLEVALNDFVANYALSLACIQQISTISTSLFDGAKDFAKRNKGTHSNGKSLNVEAYNPFTKKNYVKSTDLKEGDDIQNVVIAKEVILDLKNIDSKFLKYIEKILGPEEMQAYLKGIKSTDGQGYRLIDSYYKITVMSGENQDTNIDEWYAKYKELQAKLKEEGKGRTTFNESEIAELEAIGYIPQPKKPITQAINKFALNDADTMLIAQQHKYAEIILIPEMLPEGSRLKSIAEAMQASNPADLAEGKADIDLVIFNTGVKVGSYNAVEIYKGKDGQMSAEEVKAAIRQSYETRPHKVNLKYTRVQTSVPEHIHDSRGFGTQLRKVFLQGINRASNYSKYFKFLVDKGYTKIKITKNKSANLKDLKGNDYIKLYNAIISANYIESFRKLKGTFKDKQKLSDILSQQTILGANGNLINLEAYMLNPDGKTFYAPLFDAIREHDVSANFLSLYKKAVNKQTTLGGSAVQAAAFGITSKEESENLKYLYDDDGNVIGAECEIAWDVRITNEDGVEEELLFEDWCEPNGELKKDDDGQILLDKYYPNARKLIAYRIPTEDFYSVMNLTIVRFTRKTATGGIIKVPMQGVTQAGFDFDIDKLYLIRYEYRKNKISFTDEEVAKIWREIYDENPHIEQALSDARLEHFAKTGEKKDLIDFWGSGITADIDKTELFNDYVSKYKSTFVEYDPSKTPLENSKTARNNLLFEMLWCRMTDPETARMRLTPGGFDKARAAAKFIRELIFNKKDYQGKKYTVKEIFDISKNSKEPESEYSVLSFNTILRFNQMNQIADKLIGVFANHNSNAMMSSLMHRLDLTPANSIKFGSLLNPNVTIKRGDINLQSSEIGCSLLGDIVEIRDSSGKIIESYNILTNVHELIAAAVDAVKDPVLNYLGLTTETAHAAALLGRLGYTSKDVGLLFNQPVVKAYLKRIASGESRGFAYTKLKNEISKKDSIVKTESDITEDMLLSNLLADDALKTNTSEQLAILDLFVKILNMGAEVNNFVKITKNTASNSIGSNFSKMYEIQHSYEKLSKSVESEEGGLSMELSDDERTKIPLKILNLLEMNDEDYLHSIIDSPFAFEQAAYDCNKAFLLSLSDYFPYETDTYKAIRNMGYQYSLRDHMSEDTITDLHNDIIMMALTLRGTSYFDPNNIVNVNGTQMSYMEYCIDYFPGILEEFIAEEGDNVSDKYPLFGLLEVVRDEEGNATIIMSKQKDADKNFKYELSTYFEDMIFSDNSTVREVARLLIMYHYFKNGFSFTTTSFSDLFSPIAMSVIPANTEGETYYDVLNLLLDDAIEIDPDLMVTRFVQNHPDNKDFVKQFNKKEVIDLFNKSSRLVKDENNEDALYVELNVKDAMDMGICYKKGSQDSRVLVPTKFIKVNGVLYKAKENSYYENATTVLYVGLETLGSDDRRRVYSKNESHDVSKSIKTEEKTPSAPYSEDYVSSVFEDFKYKLKDMQELYVKCMSVVKGELDNNFVAQINNMNKTDIITRLTNLYNTHKTIIVIDPETRELTKLC